MRHEGWWYIGQVRLLKCTMFQAERALCAKPKGQSAGFLGLSKDFIGWVEADSKKLKWSGQTMFQREVGAPSERLSLYLLVSFEEFGFLAWGHWGVVRGFQAGSVCMLHVFDQRYGFERSGFQGFLLLLFSRGLHSSNLFFTLQPFIYGDSKKYFLKYLFIY